MMLCNGPEVPAWDPQVYLQHYPDSVTAINLKACNHFRLYNGKAAEAELAVLKESTSSAYTYVRGHSQNLNSELAGLFHSLLLPCV